MLYIVHQITLPKDVRFAAQLNFEVAEERYPALKAQNTLRRGSVSYLPVMGMHFRAVSRIEAANLEDVFEIGNGYGDQTKTEAVDPALDALEPPHSLSVGDIVECVDTGVVYMCDPVGWTSL